MGICRIVTHGTSGVYTAERGGRYSCSVTISYIESNNSHVVIIYGYHTGMLNIHISILYTV